MTDHNAFDEDVRNSLNAQLTELLRDVPDDQQEAALGDVWLVLEGDWGGQIYLTVPWKCVPRVEGIGPLLRAMDALAWGPNALDGTSARLARPVDAEEASRHARAFYGKDERFRDAGFDSIEACADAVRFSVAGGMGGGRLVPDRLWLHEEFLGKPVSAAQPLVDELRGATCEEVAEQNWPERVAKTLGLEPV